ncbi:P-loop containing nucleoside triphosphate hydrolase protein [Obba rivulosa]|uniref:ATP-dependent DNA helicase n=1 Tax=Obba rivulosa TaxID=1052685 RepID=A0A8E2DV58_9APHY|nr:P-loop containing nucleoside triphosphate hydrolase protein [Obba rivulosa]
MSSDEYFDDDLDSAFMTQVDAIEAAHASSSKQPEQTVSRPPAGRPATSREVIGSSDSDDFGSFDIELDDAELQRIDEICQNEVGRSATTASRPVAGPSNPVQRRPSKNAVQTTLFGDTVPEASSKPKSSGTTSHNTLQRTTSGSRTLSAGRARKTKQWDHTEFAKTGWKKGKKGKGKGLASFDDEGREEETVEFEQFPAPFNSLAVCYSPPPPMTLTPDLLAAKRWLYPLNQPKRDYQFNIVKHSLFENTLVSLPTGLGKTFIAGVVMLNFYTWFPEGKVVFVAPTKPLVAQQIDACHRTCGIPGSHAAELTGEISRAKRAGLWQEKRVFYMTPQALMSDLTSDNCDPSKIILLVIDEAHKGSGDYAYAQIVRFMMAKNPHFRILALTATPGSNPEAVQAIVDALHISHVEIRDEQSMDLRPYMHTKHTQQHHIKMTEDVNKVKDLMATVMQPLIKQAQGNGALPNTEASTLHPYRCQVAAQELRMKKVPSYVYSVLHKLTPLARAMGYLFEASVGMCYTALHDISTGASAKGKKTPDSQNDKAFQILMSEMESLKQRGFPLHPKMEKLQELLIQHFAKDMFDREEKDREQQPTDRASESRAIVFVSFRECVDEVVEMLRQHNPLIRVTRFIGQGTDKQGRKGHTQKEQLETIKRFKAGEFNVMVSTSIGEEGLDIGEVDLIVCYDAQKTPIRMLQRIGRTGRKKDGYVHVLLAEGREENNWAKAQSSYKEVQRFIVRAEQLELYGDVPRLLPEHVKPDCVEMEMEIEQHVREEPSRKRSLAGGDSPGPKAKRRKRDEDPERNMPTGAVSGFVNVKDLIAKGAKRRAKKQKEFDILAGESDEDDKDIEAGVFGSRRTLSTSTIAEISKAKKPRRAKTMPAKDDDSGPPKKRNQRKKRIEATELPNGDHFERMGVDDEDDAAIEAGVSSIPPPPKVSGRCSPSPRTPSPRRGLLSQIQEEDVIDLTTPAPAPETSPRSLMSSVSLTSSPGQPLASRSTSAASGSKRVSGNSSAIEIPDSPSISSRSLSAEHQGPDASMAWLIEDDDDPEIQLLSPAISPSNKPPAQDLQSDNLLNLLTSSQGETKQLASKGSPQARDARLKPNMPPPALPARFSRPTLSPADDAPEPSFVIRAPGRQIKKRIAEPIDSSPLAMPPPLGRLQRRAGSSSPPPPPDPQPALRKAKKRKFKDIREAQKRNSWLDVEATHSGDERSAGSSSEDKDEYEKDFVQENPTQASPSYDQLAVYRRSLMTQAQDAPMFANRPARRGGYAFAGPSRAQPTASSSPRDEADEYEFGSFVVHDDAEMSYLSSE